ncbi:MAG TPA: phosphatidate cytidylyltransferase [Xanthobacteraceae bacterium]|nr:phosphatidate cytidylyltransferase [Xanthobacteraceae bacterium]
MADPGPADPSSTIASGNRELMLRICSALVLVPLAIGTAYLGGWPFALFWSLAALGVFWEWGALVAGDARRPVTIAGGAALVVSLGLAAAGRFTAAVIVTAIGIVAIAPMAPARHRGWVAGGVPYAGAIGIAPIALRSDSEDGFVAVIFLFAIVWTTDIVAYFMGRLIGGPKLLPRVSPKKTWSGAISGLAAAVLAALAVANAAGLSVLLPIALVAAALSCVAQAGDLFESRLKRRFGAKDSSHLIPGHGGLMDRLDGFVLAAAVAALIGTLRGGIEAPARGLLVW